MHMVIKIRFDFVNREIHQDIEILLHLLTSFDKPYIQKRHSIMFKTFCEHYVQTHEEK